jgi:hypothetical protein
MFVSERFLGRLAKLRKQHREAPRDEQIELVREAFLSMMSGLPERMPEDVFELITDRISERSTGDDVFIDEAKYLADVADLFAHQYDEENDPIHPDDWELIGDIVNDYALDLDMETVNYVMKLVVDHHGV